MPHPVPSAREPWPTEAAELEALQRGLAELASDAPVWRPVGQPRVGGVFVSSPTGLVGEGSAGDPCWVAAVVVQGDRTTASAVVRGEAGAPYATGLLALREGALLGRAVRALAVAPDVLLVNATGRDHPRRAGLALHLGWALDVPTAGVTDRPLLGRGEVPAGERGSAAPLVLGDQVVGFSVRTRRRARPVFVHAAWRTDPEAAREVVLGCAGTSRTPEPLRRARHLARVERARDEGRLPPGWRDV